MKTPPPPAAWAPPPSNSFATSSTCTPWPQCHADTRIKAEDPPSTQNRWNPPPSSPTSLSPPWWHQAAAAPPPPPQSEQPPPAMADQGPCPSGFSHQFNGYLSCALNAAAPCARRAIVGTLAKPVLMSECLAACGLCVGLSLYTSVECWIYDSWVDNGSSATRHIDKQSVICLLYTSDAADE